jgi:hypothetical protein
MNRKRLIDLSTADLLENQVWEYCMADNIEYVSASDKTEVAEDSNIVHIVVTDLIFKNKEKHIGYCSPPGPEGLDNIQPVVFTDKGPVEFYKETDWTEDEKNIALLKLGLDWKDVFPVGYTTRIKCGRKLHNGTLLDFNEGK